MLPDAWVAKIFGRMEAIYGALFLDRWRGCDMHEVKRVWATELASFGDNPGCYAKALDALIDECQFPPTLPQFAALCRKRYTQPSKHIALAGPRPLTPEEVAARSQQLSEVISKPRGYDFKAWAAELRKRYLSGQPLLPIQIAMASEALGEVWLKGACTPAVVADQHAVAQ